MQNGKRPIYEKPEEFLASLTYPTHSLRNLVREVVLRLAGKNDKAVRQLKLHYSSGKTHTLITMRHLVHDPVNLPDLPAHSSSPRRSARRRPQPARGRLVFRQYSPRNRR